MIGQVPVHLSHKISQEAWEWMNMESHKLYQNGYIRCKFTHFENIREWMIMGYWIITYFLNPSQENLDFMIKNLYYYKMIESNLEYLKFREGLNRFVKRS